MGLPQKVEEQTEVMMGNNQALIQTAFETEIATEDDLSMAVDIISEIKERVKNIESERIKIVKPINDSVKNINARFKAITQPLLDAETALKPKILSFQRKIEEEKRKASEQEKRRIEAELTEEAKKASEIGNAEAAARLQEASQRVVVKPEESGRGGFTGAKTVVTKRWTFEVENVLALANARPELVKTDDVMINAAIRNGERKIPGIRIFQQENISVR